jgi:hypothetical protein
MVVAGSTVAGSTLVAGSTVAGSAVMDFAVMDSAVAGSAEAGSTLAYLLTPIIPVRTGAKVLTGAGNKVRPQYVIAYLGMAADVPTYGVRIKAADI